MNLDQKVKEVSQVNYHFDVFGEIPGHNLEDSKF